MSYFTTPRRRLARKLAWWLARNAWRTALAHDVPSWRADVLAELDGALRALWVGLGGTRHRPSARLAVAAERARQRLLVKLAAQRAAG